MPYNLGDIFPHPSYHYITWVCPKPLFSDPGVSSCPWSGAMIQVGCRAANPGPIVAKTFVMVKVNKILYSEDNNPYYQDICRLLPFYTDNTVTRYILLAVTGPRSLDMTFPLQYSLQLCSQHHASSKPLERQGGRCPVPMFRDDGLDGSELSERSRITSMSPALSNSVLSYVNFRLMVAKVSSSFPEGSYILRLRVNRPIIVAVILMNKDKSENFFKT